VDIIGPEIQPPSALGGPPGDSIITLMFRVCSEPLISERRSQQSSGGG
jgi:hypothetical protein